MLGPSGPRATAGALAGAVLLSYVLAGGDTPGFAVLPWSARVWELAPVFAVLVAEVVVVALARRGPPRKGEERWSGNPSAKGT